MNRQAWVVICLAYILGLLATSFFYFSTTDLSWLLMLQISFGLAAAIALAKFWGERSGKLVLENQVWLIALVIGVLALVYFNLRIPQPGVNDLANLVTPERSQQVTVTGKVLNEPRLNSSYKLKFWLKAQSVKIDNTDPRQDVSGKIYVTLPLLLGKDLAPGQIATLQGNLYRPKPALDPHQFDFARYLQKQSSFAGLTGYKLISRSGQDSWGWHKLRNRIVRAQIKGLGSPNGQLVSSMVLGRRAVDLPPQIRNLFVVGGLAHILAASGFHVSLLLGVILRLTQFVDEKKQLSIGIGVLLFYVGLTGCSPSVIRAVLMGIAILIAQASQAKIRPLGALLLVALLILLVNPLWIWDLGFQLSFLATFGLVFSLPGLIQKLDWLPPTIATAIAVPLAATIWVLPLIIYTFSRVSTYGILVNILTTPLMTVISLGGMLASAIALINLSLGAVCAWLLKYPVLLLVVIVRFFTELPGSSLAVGNIPLWLILGIYGVIIWLCYDRRLQKYWWLSLIAILGLIFIPLQYQQANLLQVSVLNTTGQPAIIIQDHKKVFLVNSSKSLNERNFQYGIMPFFASQGINRVDYLVILGEMGLTQEQNLQQVRSQIPISQLVVYGKQENSSIRNQADLKIAFNSAIATDSVKLQPGNHDRELAMQVDNRKWLIGDRSFRTESESESTDVLVWLGKDLDLGKLEGLNGGVAIAKDIAINPDIENKSTRFYSTKNQGTISWNPDAGFTTAQEGANRNNVFW